MVLNISDLRIINDVTRKFSRLILTLSNMVVQLVAPK